jgi:hypothetical protein
MTVRDSGPTMNGNAPRQYSLVRFLIDELPPEFHDEYPFTRDGVYVFFGDIPNMPGHCVVAEMKTGRLYSGYHTEHFAEIPEDEA